LKGKEKAETDPEWTARAGDIKDRSVAKGGLPFLLKPFRSVLRFADMTALKLLTASSSP